MQSGSSLVPTENFVRPISRRSWRSSHRGRIVAKHRLSIAGSDGCLALHDLTRQPDGLLGDVFPAASPSREQIVGVGERSATTSGHRIAAISQPTKVEAEGPTVLGFAFETLVRVERRFGLGPARHCDRLAEEPWDTG